MVYCCYFSHNVNNKLKLKPVLELTKVSFFGALWYTAKTPRKKTRSGVGRPQQAGAPVILAPAPAGAGAAPVRENNHQNH